MISWLYCPSRTSSRNWTNSLTMATQRTKRQRKSRECAKNWRVKNNNSNSCNLKARASRACPYHCRATAETLKHRIPPQLQMPTQQATRRLSNKWQHREPSWIKAIRCSERLVTLPSLWRLSGSMWIAITRTLSRITVLKRCVVPGNPPSDKKLGPSWDRATHNKKSTLWR
jgi:hypothetical protein